MTDTNTIIRLELPRLGGSRWSAEELAQSLPADLRGFEVELDGSKMATAAQGFADELCKQILEVRQADRLILRETPEIFTNHVVRSSELRRCQRVSVEGARFTRSADLRPDWK